MPLDKSDQDTECKGGGPDSAASNDVPVMVYTSYFYMSLVVC